MTGRYGTIGEVFYIEDDYWPLNTTLYVRDFKGNDPLFTYYFLKTIDYRQYSDKAAVPGVNRNHLHTAEITVPTSVAEQRRIASILSAFDDKIQINHQINQTLEQMAQAIFKSWFVDFEPVKAKVAVLEAGGSEEDSQLAAMQAISGKDADQLAQIQAEQPEQYAELQATAELFPSAMQDSELGEIPEGWEVQPVGNIAETVAMGPFGSDIKRDSFVDQGVPVINGQQLSGLFLRDGKNNYIAEGHADRLRKSNVCSGDIVITHRGTLGQVSIIPDRCRFKRYVVSQSQCFIRVNRDTLPPMFLVLFLRSHAGQHALLSFKSQVGVPAISRPVTNIRKIELTVPPPCVLRAFQKIATSFQENIMSRVGEISTLTQLRDTLLPKLLSGELTIPEAKEQVAEQQDVAHV